MSSSPQECLLPARSVAATLRPHTVLKAFRAELTALSTSAVDACDTSTSFLPVEGLIVENVFPSVAATHSLSLRTSAGDANYCRRT
jgi:hypothetical protein